MVEGTALEKRHTGNRIVSSNLTPTAIELVYTEAMSNVLDLKQRKPGTELNPEPAPLPVSDEAVLAAAPEDIPDTETENADVTYEEPMDIGALAAAMIESAELPKSAVWTAHHALQGEARRRHVYLSIGLVGVGVGISLLQRSVIPFFVLLAGAVALELREHLGKPSEVEIDQFGVSVNGKRYEHASFASFHIHRMPDDTAEVSLKSGRRMLPDLRLPLGAQDPEELHAVLTQYIPEEEHKIPLVEYLLRKPRR